MDYHASFTFRGGTSHRRHFCSGLPLSSSIPPALPPYSNMCKFQSSPCVATNETQCGEEGVTSMIKQAVPVVKALSPSPLPRKRVRFGEESDPIPAGEEGQERSVKRRIIEFRPLCSELQEEEKSRLWIRSHEKKNIVNEANVEAQLCRRTDNRMILMGQSQFSFTVTYQNIYSVCHLANEDEHFDISSILSPEVLTFMNSGNARGLEDRTVPQVAIERRLARRYTISSVLQAQEKWKRDPERVRQVSQACSLPSRRLATALGVTDATVAMLEYASSLQGK